MSYIKVCRDFSLSPGLSFIEEGKHSGEEFRVNILAPAIKRAIAGDSNVTVDLDGTAGITNCWLEEAFGGLISKDKFTSTELVRVLHVTSIEEPFLILIIGSIMLDRSIAQREYTNG